MSQGTILTNSRLALGSLLAFTLSAQGEFVLVEDFEGLPLGPLGTQNDWNSDPDYSVALDPLGGTNQVLKYEFGAQAGAYKDLMDGAIADGEIGTLYYHLRFTADGNANTGFSDVAAPAVYGDFESQVNRQRDTPLKARNGSAFQDFFKEDGVTVADDPDVWYAIWIVANNATDSSRVFIQSNDDPDFLTQTEVRTSDGTMLFRNGTTDPLATLMLRSQEGMAFWDDIYVSAGEDLTDPAPLPVAVEETLRIVDFQYSPLDNVAELSWTSIPGHEYAIETSGDFGSWKVLDDKVTADSPLTSTELFDEDAAPIDGRLFFRIQDLGVPGL